MGKGREQDLSKMHDRCEYYYTKYYKLVYSLCARSLGSEDAKDVTQLAFISLFNNYVCAGKDLEDEEIKALLIRISSSKVVDFIRKYNKPVIYYDDVIESFNIHQESYENVERSVIVKEVLLDVLGEINTMTEEWQAIIILTIYGLKAEEISTRLGISIANVRMKLSRIRKRLRNKYGDMVSDILS